MRALKGSERLEVISAFKSKLSRNGLTIAEFSRRRKIKKSYFYKRLYDAESGLCGKVRDAILNYLVE